MASKSLRSAATVAGDEPARALSLVNAARPPQGRKRVWRACNWCKAKKAKCDGSEPCNTCISNSVDCVYPEYSFGPSGKGVPMEQIQSLENRMLSMEAMFREFLERQASQETPTSNPEQQSDSRPGPCPGGNRSSPRRPLAEESSQTVGAALAHGDENDKSEQVLDAIIAGEENGPMEDAGCNSPAAVPKVSLTTAPPRVGKLPPREGPSPGRDKVAPQSERLIHAHAQETAMSPFGDIFAPFEGMCGDPEIPEPKRRRREVRIYTDEYGILDTDSTGELRYVGSQATVSIANVCDGLRSYIQSGLREKGYETREYYFGSPSESVDPAYRFEARRDAFEIPPQCLVNKLVQSFYDRLYPVFPIIQRDDFHHQYQHLLGAGDEMNDFVSVFFAVLAVSSRMLPSDDPVFDEPGCRKYRHASLGLYFYAMAKNALDYSHYTVMSIGDLAIPLNTQQNSINRVIAMGLSSSYLAATGNEAEAWTTIGTVIRLGQDLGLHRSPEKLRLPEVDWKKRRCLWLCLYILDRSLSISLGRQLAINDADCDLELPSNNYSEDIEDLTGFFALVRLHRTSGEIISLTSSINNVKAWHNSGQSLRKKVNELSRTLQRWASDSVPPHIKQATQGQHFTERSVLLCAFFASVMLLHKPFMANPHRESPLGNAEAIMQCARAAIKCIGSAADSLRSIPPCHFLTFYGQQVFVSSVLLMHCLRISKDELSMTEVMSHVQNGVQALKCFDHTWPGARKCCGIVEEFLAFTLEVLKAGKAGRCYFHDGELQPSHSRSLTPSSSMTALKNFPQSSGQQLRQQRHMCCSEDHQLTPQRHISTMRSNTSNKLNLGGDGQKSSSQSFLHDFNLKPSLESKRRRDDFLDQPAPPMLGTNEWESLFDMSDFLNKDNCFSADHLSPFLDTTELAAPFDIWSVL